MWVVAAVRGAKSQHLLLQALPWLIGVLFALIGLGWLILKLREWFNEDDGPAADAEMMLTQFREMQGEGDLSDEEYRLIKRKLFGDRTSGRTSNAPSPQASEPARPVSPEESSE